MCQDIDKDDESYTMRKTALRIDDYWQRVLKIRNVLGALKYETLGKVAMAGLSLAHGNADVERGFSTNKRLITTDRVRLCPETVNACRLVKDTLNHTAGRCATNVAIVPALLRSARASSSKYRDHLEEEKGRRQEQKKQKIEREQKNAAEKQKKREEEQKIEQKRKDAKQVLKEEGIILSAETEQRKMLSGSSALLQEAELKLSEAIKLKDIDKITVAQGLLEIGRKRMNEATSELAILAEKRRKLSSKKENTI